MRLWKNLDSEASKAVSFKSSFLNWTPLCLFVFCVIALAGTSSRILSRISGSGHLSLLPDVGGKSCMVKYDVTCRFCTDTLYQVEDAPSAPSLLRVLKKSQVGVEFCLYMLI